MAIPQTPGPRVDLGGTAGVRLVGSAPTDEIVNLVDFFANVLGRRLSLADLDRTILTLIEGEDLVALMEYYGIDEQLPPEVIHKFKIWKKADLEAWIKDKKRESIKPSKAMAIMVGYLQKLEDNLAKNHIQLKDTERACLRDFYSRMCNQLDYENTFDHILDARASHFDEKAKNIAKIWAHAVTTLLDKPTDPERYKKVGIISRAGWTGHMVAYEVRKKEDGTFQFVVANAGQASEKFHIVLGKDRVIATNVYEVESAAKAEEILIKIAMLTNSPPSERPHEELEKEFYDIFADATRIIDYGLPPSPFQTMGNCTTHGPKLLEYLLLPKQATKIRDALYEIAAEQASYPALRKTIPKPGERPPIPLPAKGKRLQLIDKEHKRVHLLPEQNETYAISVDGNLTRGPQNTYLSIRAANHTHFLETSLLSGVTIMRGDVKIPVRANERHVELESGDIIEYRHQGRVLKLVVGKKIPGVSKRF